MIARAASAALAMLAGSLVTPFAAAEPPPPLTASPRAEGAAPIAPAPPVDASPADAPPVVAPPISPQPVYAPPISPQPVYAPPIYPPPVYAPPGYVPPGYAPPGYAPPFYSPRPSVWRDGAWRVLGGSREAPPRPPARDPMLATGVVLGVAGLLTTVVGVGWFVSASSSERACGLSGCITAPHKQSRTSAAATIAGGVSGALFGSVLAFGGRGPTPDRQSNGRMVTGLVFTAFGLSAVTASLVQAIVRKPHQSSSDDAFPSGYSIEAASDNTSPVALALTAGVSLAVGLPLWLTGARERTPARYARAAVSSLELLPSMGGAALRWTR